MERYYDWKKTFSYNADITMVVTARGYGKTYGIRKQVINDWLKRGERFVAITRYSKRIPRIMSSYFTKVAKEFDGYYFKCEGDGAYISTDNKHWERFGWFVAMTDKQSLKEQSFVNVKRIIFDECLIEKDDEFHRYLDDEWGKLASIVNTVARERASSVVKPKVYLIGNACGMVNPFFQVMKIYKEPPEGVSWWLDGLVLLDYHDDPIYSQEARKTLAGRMETAQNGDSVSVSLDNKFVTADESYIASKTSLAKFQYTFIFHSVRLNVWVDCVVGLYYVSVKQPKNNQNVYALTLDDKPNYQLLEKSNILIRNLWDCYKLRAVRFDNTVIWQTVLDLFKFCGYK